MKHISHSELKQWDFCPHFHKLTRIDKLMPFVGNEHTSFGKAIHKSCENIIMDIARNNYISTVESQNTQIEPSLDFLNTFDDEIKATKLEYQDKTLIEFKKQGLELIPEFQEEMQKYFSNFAFGNPVEIACELELRVPIEKYPGYEFLGYIDFLCETEGEMYHIIDWKACSWGWDAKRKNDKILGYQLVLYKHFLSVEHDIPPERIKTSFCLLKRTAKAGNKIEFVDVSSGPQKTKNALKLLDTAIYNIENKRYIKKRTSCSNCVFSGTEYCK